MKRASPADLRKALELAHELIAAGILFVPMPVTGKGDRAALVEKSARRLERMEKKT